MEKKYYQTSKLQESINWTAIMPLSRYAGGHDEHMELLFTNSEVMGHYNEGDYQGEVATCVKLESGELAIYNDYYGSCSGCDSWEDATDEEVKTMCIGLSNSAHIFKTMEDVKEFLSCEKGAEHFDWDNVTATGLFESINEK